MELVVEENHLEQRKKRESKPIAQFTVDLINFHTLPGVTCTWCSLAVFADPADPSDGRRQAVGSWLENVRFLWVLAGNFSGPTR